MSVTLESLPSSYSSSSSSSSSSHRHHKHNHHNQDNPHYNHHHNYHHHNYQHRNYHHHNYHHNHYHKWLRRILHVSWRDKITNKTIKERPGQKDIESIIRKRRNRGRAGQRPLRTT